MGGVEVSAVMGKKLLRAHGRGPLALPLRATRCAASTSGPTASPLSRSHSPSRRGSTLAAPRAVKLPWSSWFSAKAEDGEGSSGQEEDSSPKLGDGPAEELHRVAILGANGRLGQCIAEELLSTGRHSVAAVVRTPPDDASLDGFARVTGGVDLVAGDEAEWDSLGLLDGVETAVIAVGAGGQEGGSAPEDLDGKGVRKFVDYAASRMTPSRRTESAPLDVGREWGPLNDTIMGGRSSSATFWRFGDVLCFTGEVVFQDGGFCGNRSAALELDLSQWDGISLRVRGDGQAYKLNVKTGFNKDVPECTYQASFSTSASGEWQDVDIFWRELVPVKQADVLDDAPPFDAANVCSLGFVLSRFAFNGTPNPDCREGRFMVEVDMSRLVGFRRARPNLVLVSSAAVERNQRIGSNEQQRGRDIPIVQMNPRNILNAKYYGEACVRASGLPYAIVRPTGLRDSIDEPGLLEFSQGDTQAGLITRSDVAIAARGCIDEGAGLNTTFEVNFRPFGEGSGHLGQLEYRDWTWRAMAGLVPDTQRPRAGLPPFPAPDSPADA